MLAADDVIAGDPSILASRVLTGSLIFRAGAATVIFDNGLS